jgi:hypothetical protein
MQDGCIIASSTFYCAISGHFNPIDVCLRTQEVSAVSKKKILLGQQPAPINEVVIGAAIPSGTTVNIVLVTFGSLRRQERF